MSHPIQMSESQAALLFGQKPQQPGKGQQRAKKRKEDLPENIVESQIKSFLESRGWLVERQQAGTVIGVGMIMGALKKGPITSIESLYGLMSKWGKKGRADWVAVRPVAYVDAELARRHPGMVQRIELEVKAPGKKPSPEQRKYLEDRAAVGFLVGWFDQMEADEFGADTAFIPWYQARFAREGGV